MPLFKSRAPPKSDVDILLESIAKGQYDEETFSELQRLANDSADEEVDRIAESLLGNIIRTDDRNVLTGTVKALTVLPFLPEGKEDHTIRLMVTLFAVPQNTRITLQHKLLQNEILKFLLSMIKTDERHAQLMMAELIASLGYAYITPEAEAYPALEKLAFKKPEYFRPHAEALVKLLGSINKTTRARSAKLIGIIGAKYPEYVSSAMPVLQSLASFYPDAQVKHNASEAYQILYHGLRLDVVETVAMKEEEKPKQRSVGFADILKKKASELLSKPPQETAGERQRAARNAARERGVIAHATGELMTKPPSRHEDNAESHAISPADMVNFEAEIKEILDKTREDFTNDAEGILNSIGVGHLSIKNRDKIAITNGEALLKGTPASDSGMAGQPPETDKPPIHARSSHLEGISKPMTYAEHEAHNKALEAKNAAGSENLANAEKKYPVENADLKHEAHSSPIKAGFKANLREDMEARDVQKPSVSVQMSATESKLSSPIKQSRADIMEKHERQVAQTLPAVQENKPAGTETAHVHKSVKQTEQPAMPDGGAVAHAHIKPVTAETPHGKPVNEGSPQAKRVEKAIAWAEKVGIPEPSPKAAHHTGTAQQPARESVKAAPEQKPQQAPHQPKHEPKAELPQTKKEAMQQPARSEAHTAQHHVKPETATKPEAAAQQKPDVAKAPKAETVPEKHMLPKHEHKIESSVLPPRAAVSRHEKAPSSDPTAPTAARKINVSRIGMTDKPLESNGVAEEGKKEALVPGTSISGFGQNKQVYKCPKCGARTLVEGELCKICKMTMERPEEMVRCERCGLMNNRNTRFCRKCGAKLEKSTKPPE